MMAIMKTVLYVIMVMILRRMTKYDTVNGVDNVEENVRDDSNF